MILKDVKDYVKSRQQVSLEDVALHFEAQPEAVQGMLDFWVSKGRLIRQTNTRCCSGSCCSVGKDGQLIYRWNSRSADIPLKSFE